MFLLRLLPLKAYCCLAKGAIANESIENFIIYCMIRISRSFTSSISKSQETALFYTKHPANFNLNISQDFISM